MIDELLKRLDAGADYAHDTEPMDDAAFAIRRLRAEREKLQAELIGVLTRETDSLRRWEAKVEAAEAERDTAREWLGAANNEFGSAAWDWPDLWRRIAKLKELSNERWRRAEAAEAERDALAARVKELEGAYGEGWRFAYRQWEATGSVPDPDHAASAEGGE